MRAQYPSPHGPCRSPPLVVPRGGGGGGLGDRHLVNPKFFVAAHCVVVWVAVLWGTTTCIPCTHGRTFCSLSLKWNLTTQPCFPPGTSVMFIRSTGEPVLAQVVGHSEHGDAYRRISYDRDGNTVLHDRASVMCGAWDTVLGTSCILQGTFPKGNGFPKICLRLPSLLPRRQNHHPRVLPKAFEWKVVSMCKSSR